MRHARPLPRPSYFRRSARVLLTGLLSLTLVMGGSASIATPDPGLAPDADEIEEQLRAAIEGDSDATQETGAAEVAAEATEPAEAQTDAEADAAATEDEAAAPPEPDTEGAPDEADSQGETGAAKEPAAPRPFDAGNLPGFSIMQAGPGQTTIRVDTGGLRTGLGAGAVAPAGEGLTFYAIDATRGNPPGIDATSQYTCTTDATGSCDIVVPDRTGGSGNSTQGYWITQAAAGTADWQRIDNLGTGAYNQTKTVRPYLFHTGNVSGQDSIRTVTQDSQTYAHGGVTQARNGVMVRATNPPLPPTCGLSTAIVLDNSSSISSSELTQLKNAAKAFVGNDGLGGTPSVVSLFSFNTRAEIMELGISLAQQDGVTDAVNAIDGLTTSNGYTNWDDALQLVTGTDEDYDLVIFVTDGDPTTFGTGGTTNTTINFQQLELAVAAANTLKQQPSDDGTGNTRILGLGVGMSNNSALNLQAITGPTAGQDYYEVDDFPALEELLGRLATESCGGTITVSKEIVDETGTVIDATPGGWEFTATTTAPVLEDGSDLVSTLSRTTDDQSGAVNFGLDFSDGRDARPVTVTETQQPNHVLVQQNGANAVCSAGGQSVPVTNVGELGFRVDVELNAIVGCTVRNQLLPQFEDLTVTKTAVTAFDRDYDWAITKDVDGDEEVTVPADTPSASFDYDVVVTPSAPSDSGFEVTGTITVTNPNDVAVTGVDVQDELAIPGATCSIAGGGQDLTVPVGAPLELDYTCSLPDDTSATASGTNTATAVWDADDFPGTTGSASGSATADFAEATVTTTNRTVTLTDDSYDFPGAPIVLDAEDPEAPFTFDYSIDWDAPAGGQCVTHTNTATIANDTGIDESDDADVEICAELPLTVAKTANASFDRTYLWDITKDVDATTVEVADAAATFTYTVEAVPAGFTDSGWTLDGEITVTNPNPESFDDVLATVSDAADVGDAVCTVDPAADVDPVTPGVQVLVPAGGDAVVGYSCTVTPTAAEYEGGTNTATATWTDASGATALATGAADVTFELDGETDRVVDVADDQTDPANPVLLGEATWNAEGTPTPFTYPLTHEGVPGKCVDFTNTAWVETTGEDPQDGTTVTVCVEDDITVVKTAEASYDRLYEWDIDKSVDDTDVEVDEDGRATYTYTVNAVADGFTDSGWAMTGTVTVHNPNTYDDGAITVNVVDVTDVGAQCTVAGGTDLTLAPGATEVLDYSCTFTEEPQYTGTNTATVSWTDADGEAAEISHVVPVEFSADEVTDLTVEVWDDKTDPANPVHLGEATWTEPGTHEFTYEVTHQGVGGQCVELTNTAWLELESGSGPDDSTTVELCVDSPLVHGKTAVWANQLPSGEWQVRYEIDVVNDATFEAVYDLSDTLELGEGISPLAALWFLEGSVVGGAWTDLPEETTAVLATDRPIAANDTHTYVVVVTADVATGVIGSDAGQCSGDEGTDGGGFLNAATLTSGDLEATDRDCLEPAAPEHAKSAGELVENGDGTWTVTYQLSATNPTQDQELYYSLVDELDLAAGVTIVSAAVAGVDDAPAPNPDWDGETDTQVVTGELLPPGEEHTFAVTVVLDLSGDIADADRQCSGDVGGGAGLFNGSTLTSGNDDYDDDACVDIPDPTIVHSKTAVGTGQNTDGSWTVTYDVVVTNESTIGGRYDLVDTIEFGAGITPISAWWTLEEPADEGAWADPAEDPTAELAADRPLAGEGTHTYRVTVQAEVGAGVIDSDAGQCSGDEGTDGGGFLNAATLTAYGDPQTDRDCLQPAAPTIDKTFESLTENTDDGTWDVRYTLDVRNPHDVTLAYDLLDEPAFADGAVIESASVANTAPGDILTNPGFDAVTDLVVVTGQGLAAGTTHTYTVTVTVDLTGVSASADSGDHVCGEGGGAAGQGLFNEATITSGNDDYSDDACVDVPDPSFDVAKTATSVLQNDDGSWTVTYDVVATNDSSVGGVYDLTDTLDFGEGITPTEAGWTLAGTDVAGSWEELPEETTAVLAVDRPLAGGTSHTYVVTVDATVEAGVIGSEAGQCYTGEVPQAGGFLNTVTLTSGGIESTDDACAEPSASPWTLSKTSDPASGSQVDPGDVIAYTLTATPTGEQAPVGVVVRDDLSGVLEHAGGYGDIVASAGSFSWDGDVLVWDIGTLAETATLTYSVVVDDDAWDVELVNVATGSGSTSPTCVDECSTTHTTPPERGGAAQPGPGAPLPSTGAAVSGLLLGALLLLGLGALTLTLVRRRRTT